MWQGVFIGILLFLAALLHFTRRPKNFPPGPFSWPVVGNIFQFGTELHKTFIKMKANYGEIFSVSIGSTRVIILHDIKLIKEAFNLNAISGRLPSRAYVHPVSRKSGGIFCAEGPEWVEQRRFVVKNLREFGFGKKSMEHLIRDEVRELIEGFQKNCGKPISTLVVFNIAVVNALWSITCGERFKHDDPKIIEIMKYILKLASMDHTITIFFSWIIDVSPKWSGYNDVTAVFQSVFGCIQKSIDYHKETYKEGIKRDLIDCYLDAISKTTVPSSFTDENMLLALTDLFIAGTETTSTTMTWICYLLTHFPKSQEKLNQVITDIIGTSRMPSLSDRPSMPFVEAVSMEAMRYSSLFSLGFGHTTLEDIEFHGYQIPKGTLFMGNHYGVHHDPKIWGDPENFRPERFLSPDGQSVIRHEAFIPFSPGKRACPGETLAKDELFLYTAAIFQRFRMEFDPNSPKPELGHSVQTLIMMPKKHKIVIHDRLQ